MNLLSSIPPAFIFFIGGILAIATRGVVQRSICILIPLISLYAITTIPETAQFWVPLMGFKLQMLRPDIWAKIFGGIFSTAAALAFIYGAYQNKKLEYASALFYIGSALGVIFAADLISLYIYWEIMAITSVMLILARKTEASRKAAMRYIIVHVFGGLVLLAGIMLQIATTFSIGFNSLATPTPAAWLILVGVLINVAALPFSSWLPDAYPEATLFGGIVLSTFTTKTALFVLIRSFAGWDILIILGVIMAIYGIVYAFLENDIRRILAYSLINQLGFKVAAVGVGTQLALAGATAHAVCGILYNILLWMGAGAIIHRTGKQKLTDLGGLYKAMPLLTGFMIIGGLAIASFPLTSGFISKPLILKALAQKQLFWPWILLEIASAAAVFHAALKLPYFTFFGDKKGIKPKSEPRAMTIAMGITALITLGLGVAPKALYKLLPYGDYLLQKIPSSFSAIYITKFEKVLTQTQLLLAAALIFFLVIPLIKHFHKSITLDIDWIYRVGGKAFYSSNKAILTTLGEILHQAIVINIIGALSKFAKNSPARILTAILSPFWQTAGLSNEQLKISKKRLEVALQNNTLPVGLVAILSLIFIGFLFIF